MNLVIIEGVGKQDTIKKYLGSDYEVVATKGHIRDLPANVLAVNLHDHFKPQYEIMPDKEAIVKMLKEKAKKADKIYLATDPDREGEAISWHLCYVLGLDENSPIRITFNEISKNAVQKGLANPRGIDIKLVNAQQARRVLDRLVGYKISPILCKKIQPRLSAGRVQSVALKLVVDREHEIEKFVPTEYWTLNAELYPKVKKDIFKATLTKINNKKANIPNKEEMDKVVEEIGKGTFVVKSVKKSLQKTHAQAPYTTSTMQQEALNKLGFNLKKASFCAQELYEGVNLGDEGKVALITYIRTDSVRVAPEAMEMAKKHIIATYGEKYVPSTPNYYKTKDTAQDAHEAIRPISLDRTPEKVKPYLSADNYKLYKLIYNKFVASQMAEATHNVVVAEINNGNYLFKASGKTPVFDGFMAAYNMDKKSTKKEEPEDDNDEGLNANLPVLVEGDVLNLEKLNPTQKYTKPPQRFTEATLVKEMEEKGIGRPATYTPTITLLASRKYTEKDGKYLKPTELGEKINELLEKYFSDIINVKFTAKMESELDDVAEHGINWVDMVGDFYKGFEKLLYACDKDSVKFKIPPKETDIICDKCGGKMVIRTGKYGEFLACSNYPTCKNIQPITKEIAKCPKCGKPVYERKSKKGKTFYGCSGYPECDFISWEIPTEYKCPKCGHYLTKKSVYGNTRYKCSNEQCDYTHIVKKPKESENK